MVLLLYTFVACHGIFNTLNNMAGNFKLYSFIVKGDFIALIHQKDSHAI